MDCLGFELDISETKFKIPKWGIVADYTNQILAHLWNVYGDLQPALCNDVEEVLRTAYEMVISERRSFEETYGVDRSVKITAARASPL